MSENPDDAMYQDPSKLASREAALEAAVSDLFQNHLGQRGGRLAIIDSDGRDLGGWCEDAVRDRVMGALGAQP